MQQWLTETFGTRDVSAIPRGIVYMTGHRFLMRKEDAVKMMAITVDG